jgi:modulator of FtsH protease HflC
MNKSFLSLPFIIAALVALSQMFYTVDQREYAVKFRLGEVVKIETEPGFKFKVPLLENIRKFDKRIVTLDTQQVETFATSEKQPIEVDSFVKWQVADPRVFYVSTSQGDFSVAEKRIGQTINSLLGEELQKRTLQEIVAGEREKIMEAVRSRGEADLSKIGVRIVDVRLKRVELPKQVSDKVFDRMRSERQRVANELRSQGGAENEKIRADADRQRQVILAEAYKQAEQTRGGGDAKAAAIYSDAYGKNPEFYSFYRSLDAYKSSFRSKNDMMVLEPNSSFFRHMKPGTGKTQ